jgi:hypothetical protein
MSVFGEEFTAEEAAVWQLEQDYYRYAKSNDPDGYLTLFDERVIGWPASDNAPKRKDKVE